MRHTDEDYFENFPIRDLENEKGKHQFEVHRELGPVFFCKYL
jgi:hypothetical protein